MKCPKCDEQNTIRWRQGRYVCRRCDHELTKREYDMLIDGEYDRWLASPPEEDTP